MDWDPLTNSLFLVPTVVSPYSLPYRSINLSDEDCDLNKKFDIHTKSSLGANPATLTKTYPSKKYYLERWFFLTSWRQVRTRARSFSSTKSCLLSKQSVTNRMSKLAKLSAEISDRAKHFHVTESFFCHGVSCHFTKIIFCFTRRKSENKCVHWSIFDFCASSLQKVHLSKIRCTITHVQDNTVVVPRPFSWILDQEGLVTLIPSEGKYLFHSLICR